MGLDKIKKAILDEAEREKKSIIAEAREKEKELLEEAERTASEERKETLENAKFLTESIKAGGLSLANLEYRQSILREKEKILDRVFEKTLQKLPEHSSRDYLKKQILETARELEGDVRLIVSSRDRKLFDRKFLSSINRELKDTKVSFSSKEENITGGVIFEIPKKKVKIDKSFDTMIKVNQAELSKEASKILFG